MSYIIDMKEKNKKERKSLRRQQRAYDRMAKQWLRDTRLLSYLIKDGVPPLASDPIEAIRGYIETDTDQIPYASGEIAFSSGAYVEPDLLFGMKKKSWQAYGNADFQKDMPKAYDLESRKNLYVAAMVCNQVGKKVDYNALRPVYSMWVVNDFRIKKSELEIKKEWIEKTEGSQVTRNELKEGMMNLATFKIGNEIREDDKDSLKVLHYLFKCEEEKKANEKLRAYGFTMEEDQRRVRKMCNLSQGFIEKGREEGRNEGRVQGRAQGRKEGAVKASVDAIRRFSKEFGVPIEKVYEVQRKDLTTSEARQVGKRLGLLEDKT